MTRLYIVVDVNIDDTLNDPETVGESLVDAYDEMVLSLQWMGYPRIEFVTAEWMPGGKS